jgi:glycosyltransferase involved in cell wall biosynthesis
MIPEVIEHGVNGFMCNDPDDMKSISQTILKNPEEYKHISTNARNTILTKFNKKTFNDNWDKLFRSLAK